MGMVTYMVTVMYIHGLYSGEKHTYMGCSGDNRVQGRT
jgi:hypothetical protein